MSEKQAGPTKEAIKTAIDALDEASLHLRVAETAKAIDDTASAAESYDRAMSILDHFFETHRKPK